MFSNFRRQCFQFPGRYAKWSLGVKECMVEIIGRVIVNKDATGDTYHAAGSECTIRALNQRGDVLIDGIMRGLEQDFELTRSDSNENLYTASGSSAMIQPSTLEGASAEREIFITLDSAADSAKENESFLEEDRTRSTPGLMAIIRSLLSTYAPPPGTPTRSTDASKTLGLYGSLGYDLTFQFESGIPLARPREEDERALVFYIPEEVLVIDQERRRAWSTRYEFEDRVTGRKTSEYVGPSERGRENEITRSEATIIIASSLRSSLLASRSACHYRSNS